MLHKDGEDEVVHVETADRNLYRNQQIRNRCPADDRCQNIIGLDEQDGHYEHTGTSDRLISLTGRSRGCNPAEEQEDSERCHLYSDRRNKVGAGAIRNTIQLNAFNPPGRFHFCNVSDMVSPVSPAHVISAFRQLLVIQELTPPPDWFEGGAELTSTIRHKAARSTESEHQNPAEDYPPG